MTMKKSVELSVRASEIKSEINGLEPGDASLEKRRELHGNLNTVEAEWRTAVTEEAEADCRCARRARIDCRGTRVPPA